MNSLSEKLHGFWDKLKKIKHIEIYIAVIFAVIVIAVYISSLGGSKKTSDIPQNSTQESLTFSSSMEYAEYLENKLSVVLANVKGAGQVSVALTLLDGFEYIWATETETKKTADGGQVTTSKVVIIDGKPVLEKEIYPKIKGVVVTATGANDVGVRLNLLSALQTVIEVENQNITILAGN